MPSIKKKMPSLSTNQRSVILPFIDKTANRDHVSFMTRELLEAIRKRNKLKRLYNESKRRLDWDRYKTQRNLTSSLRRKAVSNYFRTTASNARGNPKKFWQTVKPFMHSKKTSARIPFILRRVTVSLSINWK